MQLVQGHTVVDLNHLPNSKAWDLCPLSENHKLKDIYIPCLQPGMPPMERRDAAKDMDVKESQVFWDTRCYTPGL